MKFSYEAEKFSVARSALMLPHLEGESKSIYHAFNACSLGLDNLDRKLLTDDNAIKNVSKIEELMDTSGLTDSEDKGLWKIKAELLSEEEKYDLSTAVDELASYFSYYMLESVIIFSFIFDIDRNIYSN